jgi:hypothetical protein
MKERISDARLPGAFYDSVVLIWQSQETPGWQGGVRPACGRVESDLVCVNGWLSMERQPT